MGSLKLQVDTSTTVFQSGTASFPVMLTLGQSQQTAWLNLDWPGEHLSLATTISRKEKEAAIVSGNWIKSDPTGDAYTLDCGRIPESSVIICYNGNCDNIRNDLNEELPCLPAESVALSNFLTTMDAQMATVVVNDLSFPLRVSDVQFCGGTRRLLFDDELDQIDIAYQLLSYRYIPEVSSSLILNNQGTITTGTITDLLNLRPANDNLTFQVGTTPQADPNAPIDPVTGEDPNQPVTDVTTPVSYYLYDHLGNTRMLFRADAPEAITITYAADYYPYGKILREFSACGPVRFLTTQHERDAETGYDNRGHVCMMRILGGF